MDLKDAINKRFPLLELLSFREKTPGSQEGKLPTLVGLLSTLTETKIEGDVCVLLPVRERVAAFVAILTALSAAKQHFPELRKKYLSEGFHTGERVRVLPDGHVYEFGGLIESHSDVFFKLNFLEDANNSSRAFPIKEAVRLEKTSYLRPLGRGEPWGKFRVSKLDFILGTRTAGNDALLQNEVLFVGPVNEFSELLKNIEVRRIDKRNIWLPLSKVIPWGIVTPQGKIEFQNSRAASGQPLLAVSARSEYAAAACRSSGMIAPRVVVAGVKKLKDLQAFDDLVDYSKLLVVASHAEMEPLSEFNDRGCDVWSLSNNLGSNIVKSDSPVLAETIKAYKRSLAFRHELHRCDSETVDRVFSLVSRAEAFLEDQEVDEMKNRLVSHCYRRLLDLSSLVAEARSNELENFTALLDRDLELIESNNVWLAPEFSNLLKTVNSEIRNTVENHPDTFALSKRNTLLKIVKEAHAQGQSTAIVVPDELARSSAKSVLSDSGNSGTRILHLSELKNGDFDTIILPGWPRAANFKRIVYSYASENLHCLAYEFERSWFESAFQRRFRQLSQWFGDANKFSAFTGLNKELWRFETAVQDEHNPKSVSKWDDFGQIEDLEERFRTVRKGSTSSFSKEESRDARYVSFRGTGYAYLTDTHKIPCVTGFFSGEADAEKGVPLLTATNLTAGDSVIFRASSDFDKDIIRLVAEHLHKAGEYEKIRAIAERWKRWLSDSSLKIEEIQNSLREHGMSITQQAIRGWLFDPARIGPADESVVEHISKLAGRAVTQREINDVTDAIKAIRGSHLAAGAKLTKLLLEQLPAFYSSNTVNETLIDLEFDGMPLGKVEIVEVDFISSKKESRPYWETNRLIHEQGW